MLVWRELRYSGRLLVVSCSVWEGVWCLSRVVWLSMCVRGLGMCAFARGRPREVIFIHAI